MTPQQLTQAEDEIAKQMAKDEEKTLATMKLFYKSLPQWLATKTMAQWRKALNEQKDEAKRKRLSDALDEWEKARDGK